MEQFYPENENDYNYELKRARRGRPPNHTSCDRFDCRTVNTLATPDNVRSTGSTRITSTGREAAMEQLRNSKQTAKPTVIQSAKIEAVQEVEDEIAARQRVDEGILKLFHAGLEPKDIKE